MIQVLSMRPLECHDCDSLIPEALWYDHKRSVHGENWEALGSTFVGYSYELEECPSYATSGESEENCLQLPLELNVSIS